MEEKNAGFRAFAVDISERKRMEEALRESEERLRTIFDSVRTGIMIIDTRTHVIVDANPAAIEMAGAPKEQILGSVCHKYVCPAEEGRCPITDLGQTIDNTERVLLRTNGNTTPTMKRRQCAICTVDIDNAKLDDPELAYRRHHSPDPGWFTSRTSRVSSICNDSCLRKNTQFGQGKQGLIGISSIPRP